MSQETSPKKKENIQSKIKVRLFSFKRFLKGKRSILSIRYIKLEYHVKNIMMTIVPIIIGIILVLFFLNSIGVLTINHWKIQFHNIYDFNGSLFLTSTLLPAQISITLILITVVSLISSLDKKYIYGENAIEQAFHGKGAFKIKLIYILLLILLLENIINLINGYGETAFLLVFLVTLALVLYIAYRFTLIYSNPEYFKKKLRIKYYSENIKIIKKSEPLKNAKSDYLEHLRFVTERGITDKNPNCYENVNLLVDINNITFFNNRESIQEYYTEHICNKFDCVSILTYLAEKFAEQGEFSDAVDIYVNIYRQFRFYRIVNINHNEMDFSFLINGVKYIKTEAQVGAYHDKIFSILYDYMYQSYLYSITDFSFYRLGKFEDKSLLFRLADSSFLQRYYTAILENKNLNNEEKERIYLKLYDSLRMSELSEKFPRQNINMFLKNECITSTPEPIPVVIKAEPITLLILKYIENNDFRMMHIFLSMNMDRHTMNFIRILCILSVLNMLGNGNKRKYLMDLKLDQEKVINGFRQYEILSFNTTPKELEEFYELICKHYYKNKTSDKKINVQEIIWSGFNPRLSFSQRTIDTFFKSEGLEKEKLICSSNIQKVIDSFKNNLTIKSIDKRKHK